MATILVVDDSESIRAPLRESLEGAGHIVIEACDGVAGLEVARTRDDISLIFADLNMPRLGGIAMVAEIRQHAKFDQVPIIALTTEASGDIKDEGSKAGIDVWIIKPVVYNLMPTFVERLLTRASALAKLRFGGEPELASNLTNPRRQSNKS